MEQKKEAASAAAVDDTRCLAFGARGTTGYVECRRRAAEDTKFFELEVLIAEGRNPVSMTGRSPRKVRGKGYSGLKTEQISRLKKAASVSGVGFG